MASPFLLKRRAGWYVRVPADLTSVFGATHLTRTLSTRDHPAARRRAVLAAAAFHGVWSEARAMVADRTKQQAFEEFAALPEVEQLRRLARMNLSDEDSQFSLSHETYGSPRMTIELQEDGIDVGRHRVARLMRDNGLKALQKRRFKKTTDSAHGGPVAPNLLDQDFSADGPDQKWGSDISYIWTAEGWLYLAVVVDLFSRRIVGWATSDRMKKDLALTALKRAIAVPPPPPGLIHHSDRGSQYCSGAYRKLLDDYKILASMSGKGNCYDNTMVETVFKTIKSELIWRTMWQSPSQAEMIVSH